MSASGIALALALLATSLQQPKKAEIALHYEWPAGMTVRIETGQSRERRSGDTAKSSSMSMTATMHVLPYAEGRLIQFDDLKVAGVRAGSQTAEAAALTEQIAALVMPDFVVDKAGEFVRLADVKRTKAALDGMFAPLLKESDLGDGPRQLFATLMSENTLSALGAQEWTMLVASWNGAALAEGETVQFDSDEPTPLMPDTLLKTQYRATLVSHVPCGDDAQARPDCVLLELRSTPDPASLKVLLQKVLTQTIEKWPADSVVFERYDLVNTIRLVTEPATLRPHKLETEKKLEMLISAPGEPKHASTQIDRRTSRYLY